MVGDLWGYAEFVAVITALWSAWLERDKNILLYPIGIISVMIYFVICYRSGIYADMLINGIYFVMSIYGWWRWYACVDQANHVPVTMNSRGRNLYWIGVSFLLWGILYAWLHLTTDSSIPVLDSFTTALSVTGMFLLADQKIENWYYWIIADGMSVPMFYYKGLVMTAGLSLIFCVIAVSGYCNWKSDLRSRAQLPAI